MNRSSRPSIPVATAVLVGLTAFFTWPQPLHIGSAVAAHFDPLFSLWRLSWIAHALRTDPHHLYDANIFYPSVRTLAYSDAVLMEGALGAPLIWAGVTPLVTYNLLLLLGIVGSGVAMFVLARELTGNASAALVSAAIFTVLPYRTEHIMHLELQWTMWVPLAFWAIHRAVKQGSWRMGALAGVLVWFQMLSSVYYGVFLAMLAAVLVLLLTVTAPRESAKGLVTVAAGGVLAALLTWPYAQPYLENAKTLGPRDTPDFSARLMSYVTWPRGNWLWNWTSGRFVGDELHLAPGVVFTLLAVIGLVARPRRFVWIYLAIAALAVELSLGFNGHLYPWMYAHVKALGSLRALARCAVIAYTAMAVLAAYGFDYLEQRLSTSGRRVMLCALAIALVAVESSSAPLPLIGVPTRTPDVYKILNTAPAGTVVELPLEWNDVWYEYWSMTHWKPLVNGYSGYISNTYVDALSWMSAFPDDRSITRLKRLNVRYLIVHRALFEKREKYTDLMVRIAARPDVTFLGRYRDWLDYAEMFELR